MEINTLSKKKEEEAQLGPITHTHTHTGCTIWLHNVLYLFIANAIRCLIMQVDTC